MSDARHALLRELFLAALDLPVAEHARFVRDRCGADDDLAERLAALLAAHAAPSPQLATPALGRGFTLPDPEALRAQPLPPGVPDRFGSYRLLGVLGAGGMGIVYRARQLSPPRDVALKVLRPGLADGANLARFRFEVQALGRLQHPGIATIHDAGTFDQGAGPQPFLSMELVEGRPLLDHAAAERLGHDARLELIAAIADAIQHAHQRGIVHRDLKPANVLVDGDGRPKVLDFGIAAARDASDFDVTQATEAGQLLGTLGYMSPEQLGLHRREVDTRIDVYALGVLAYELLSGQLPFALDGLAPIQAARVVAETDAPPLGRFVPQLRGDVETIVATAMSRQPERRYASAGDLAADLRRVLAHQPIAARPAGKWRRIALFTRRHRAMVAGITSTTLALALGLVATLRALDDARAARGLAEARLVTAEANAARAEAVRGFVLGMLAKLDPQRGDLDSGVERVLAAATREVETSFGGYPDLEAEMRLVLGGVLRMFGRYDAAHGQITAGLALRRSTLGDDADDTLSAGIELVKVLRDCGRWREAIELLEPLTTKCAARFGERDERSVQVRQLQARCLFLTGDLTAAERLLRPLLDLVAETPSVGAELRVDLMLDHTSCRIARGDFEGARRELVRCLAECRELLGDEDPTTNTVVDSLGTLLLGSGDTSGARPLLEEVLHYRRARLPADHPSLLQVVHNLAGLKAEEGDNAAAAALFDEVVAGRERALGPRHPQTVGSLLSRANALARAGREPEAAVVFDDAIARLGDGSSETPWLLPTALAWQAVNLARLGDLDAARTQLAQSVRTLEALEGRDSDRASRFRRLLQGLTEHPPGGRRGR